MIQKLKRSKDFEIRLNITNDNFVAPPRAEQRNWVLNRLVSEWVIDLKHLDTQASHFVAGSSSIDTSTDREQGKLDDQVIMEDWQIPVMKAMAQVVAQTHGDILEIGFGRGVSAGFIQDAGVKSHAIVECNPHIIDRFNTWRPAYADRDITLLQGLWQDLVAQFASYDAIFFHAYPLSGDELIDEVHKTTTFASNFFSVAANHLRDKGIFTYLTNEIDSLSRAHQRLLLEHFSSITLSRVDGLEVPAETVDSLWGDSMLVVTAVR